VRTTARRALAASAASAAPALERGPLDELDFSSFALLAARLRALAFYAVTVLLSLPLFVSMLLITPFQLAFDKHRRAALHFVNDLWAVCSTSLFYPVEVRGLENLPAYDEPAVLVANHQSYLDIYSLFHLRRPFKVPLQPATRELVLLLTAHPAVHLQDEQLPHPHHRLEHVSYRSRAPQADGQAQPDGVPERLPRAASPARASALLP